MKGFPKHSGIGGVQAEKELKAEIKSMATDKPKTPKTEKPTETYEQWAKRAPGTAQWVSEDEYEDMVRTTKSNIENYPGDSSGFKMKGFPKQSGVGGVEAEERKIEDIPTSAPGSQNPSFPEVLYTIDGKAVKSQSLDEGEMPLKPSSDKKGKYITYPGRGKLYYKNPTK